MKLTVGFPNIDWPFLQSVYGWAALQYQAWTRGSLTIEAGTPQRILLFTDNVLEFSVDGQHYFGGDFYAYRRAPLVLCLDPGAHTIEVRLIRDVRVMGGIGEPEVSIILKAGASEGGLAIGRNTILLPEVINEKLASSYGSVTVRNDGNLWIDIWNVESEGVGLSMGIVLRVC